MLLLSIESSCDETAAAVLADGEKLLADVVNSQVKVHEPYGGVVPELASRNHIENIYPVVQAALAEAKISIDQLDGIAVTQGPGLIGCLLVGLSFAKSICMAKNIPLIGVDHIAGHLLSVFLGEDKPSFPYIALVASGGHTSLFQVNSPTEFILLGRTRDDAAGEAFDKVAKLLGLGYPGGPVISKLAMEGEPAAIAFPRAWLSKESLDFSFSGLKTAVVNHVHQKQQQNLQLHPGNVCASFQEAVVDVLVSKTIKAAKHSGIKNIVLAGGVASNLRLRQCFQEHGAAEDFKVFLTPARFCTDNGAMIAYAGHQQFRGANCSTPLNMDAYSRSPLMESMANV